jgi:hypothetical protein
MPLNCSTVGRGLPEELATDLNSRLKPGLQRGTVATAWPHLNAKPILWVIVGDFAVERIQAWWFSQPAALEPPHPILSPQSPDYYPQFVAQFFKASYCESKKVRLKPPRFGVGFLHRRCCDLIAQSWRGLASLPWETDREIFAPAAQAKFSTPKVL